METEILKYVVELCKSLSIDIDWSNKVFWNTYRSKSISIYENLRTDGYVHQKDSSAEKLSAVGPKAFVEMPAEEMCPHLWKDTLVKLMDDEIKLHSNTASALFI
jgi:hypothetical protein